MKTIVILSAPISTLELPCSITTFLLGIGVKTLKLLCECSAGFLKREGLCVWEIIYIQKTLASLGLSLVPFTTTDDYTYTWVVGVFGKKWATRVRAHQPEQLQYLGTFLKSKLEAQPDSPSFVIHTLLRALKMDAQDVTSHKLSAPPLCNDQSLTWTLCCAYTELRAQIPEAEYQTLTQKLVDMD